MLDQKSQVKPCPDYSLWFTFTGFNKKCPEFKGIILSY